MYNGPAGTEDVGLCKAATRRCASDGQSWSGCEGEVVPTAEVCGDTADNDCDGTVDDGCACVAGTMMQCYSGPSGSEGVGNCKGGITTCDANGMGFGPCNGEVLPEPERCDTTADEDCDGEEADDGVDQGSGCACVPGSSSSCYDGPPGTQGVGLCAAGSRACKAEGTGYEPCLNDVVPSAEQCSTTLDENCNGREPINGGVDDLAGCVCAPSATRTCYSGPAGTVNVGICKVGAEVCDATGSGWGACLGQVLPGAEVCNASQDEDCNGSACSIANWAVSFPEGANDPRRIAAAPDGTVWVALTFSAGFAAGATNLIPNGGEDIALIRLSSAGAVTFAAGFGGAGDDNPLGLVADNGGVALAFSTSGSINFGGMAANGGGVVRFDANGNHQWTRSCGGTNSFDGGLSFDNLGGLVVTLGTSGTANCGLGNMIGTGPIVARLNGSGTAIWQKRLNPTINAANIAGIAADANGNVIVIGHANAAIDLGGGLLTPNGAGYDFFIAKFLAATGAHSYSLMYGGAGSGEGLEEVVVDALGNAIVVGYHTNALTIPGAGSVGATSADNCLMFKLNGSGSGVWMRSYGGADIQRCKAVALSNANGLFAVGEHWQTVNFGGANLTSGDFSSNAFAVEADAGAAHVWSRQYGVNVAYERIDAVATQYPNGYFLANAQQPVDFGNGQAINGQTIVVKVGLR